MMAAWWMALGAAASQQSTVEDARLMAWSGEGVAIVLAVDRKELREQMPQLSQGTGVRVETDGTPVRRHDISAEALDGVTLGSAWRVLGPRGETSCTVSGFSVIASDDFSMDDPVGGGMPCMEPLVVAKMSCVDQQLLSHAAVAVPASNTRAAAATMEGGTPPEVPSEAAASALTQLAPIQALQHRTELQASAMGEALQTRISVRTAHMASRQVQIVSGSFYTGEAEEHCDGEDIAAEWGGLLVDGAPIGFQAMEDGAIYAVFDLDGDGTLEMLQNTLGRTRLLRQDGTIIRAHVVDWCVCGC